jgi:hypothetical protein
MKQYPVTITLPGINREAAESMAMLKMQLADYPEIHNPEELGMTLIKTSCSKIIEGEKDGTESKNLWKTNQHEITLMVSGESPREATWKAIRVLYFSELPIEIGYESFAAGLLLCLLAGYNNWLDKLLKIDKMIDTIYLKQAIANWNKIVCEKKRHQV